MRGASISSILLLAFLLPCSAWAQGFEVGGTVGYYALAGDDFKGREGAVGFDVVGRYRLSDSNSLGVGFQFNRHFNSSVFFNLADVDIDVISIFVEGRHTFGRTKVMAPFLGARAGWVQASIDETDIDADQDGFGLGVLGGALFPLSQTVGLEVSVLAEYASFGEWEVNGQTFPTTAAGWILGFRGGINFGF